MSRHIFEEPVYNILGFRQLESKDHAFSFKIWADPPLKMGLIFHFRNLKIILIWLQIILKKGNFRAGCYGR
jgi:hypothetical protein